jgi:hypothetical protein
LQRLGAIVVSPREACADIDRRPTWVLPFVLILGCSLAISFVVYQVVVTGANFEAVARAKILWDARLAGAHETPQSLHEKVEALRQARERWYVFPFFGVVVSLLGLSVLFYVVLRLIRAGPAFRKVFAVVCWSFVIYRVLGSLVTIVALLVRGPANFIPAPPEAWSPTSLAMLVPRTAVSANAYSAISKVDLFFVWTLVVMTIGFSQTSKNLSLVRSALMVAVLEVAYLALNALGALLGAT